MNQHPAAPVPVNHARLLTAGGAFLVLGYALEVTLGLTTGRSSGEFGAAQPPLAIAASLTAPLGVGITALALSGVGHWARRFAPRAGLVASGLATTAVTASALNVLLQVVMLITSSTQLQGVVGLSGLISVLGTLIAATTLGVTSTRARALPRGAALMLALVGAITFPLILGMIPLFTLLPAYLVSSLPFAVWGGVFSVVGRTLRRAPRPARNASLA